GACQNVMNALLGSDHELNKKTALEANKDFQEIKNAFVLQSCYSGPTVQYSHGVSIYFPWAQWEPDQEAYRKLFNASEAYKKMLSDSRWVDFLQAYLAATKRPKRKGKDAP